MTRITWTELAHQIFQMQTSEPTPESSVSLLQRHNYRRTQVLVHVSDTKRLQLSVALRSQMGEPHVHTFEFVEGGIHYPAAPGELPSCVPIFVDTFCLGSLNDDWGMAGIATVFPHDQYFAYYDPTDPSSILQAIDDLAIYISAEGPFDGVMGFSQGAALAAMLMTRQSAAELFRFAIFLCAGLPFCEASLRQGVLRHLNPKVDKEVIRVPTAHIFGSKDDALPASLAMKDLCVAEGRGLFDHRAGHEVPVKPEGISGDMARCVEEAIVRATFVQ